ncbi:MAG: aminopeptidase [Clostridia bacterium]|nr:aminopeptidase [Clostridia bacterium]
MKEKDEKKTEGMKLEEKLNYVKKNFFEVSDEEKIAKAYAYADDYREYLDDSKTEREAVVASIKYAEAKGFTPYTFGEKLKVGDKKYFNNRGKSLVLFKIGASDIGEDGIRILASHIDSPRLDVKQNPLYEDGGMAYLKTHYYGGIKKYQWTAIPLALHGKVALAGGKTVDVKIGDAEGDPVFYVDDLLPHLSREQAGKPLSSAIDGETLNILVGGRPYNDEKVKEKVRLTVLKKLNEEYGMTESDFLSAELCAVPAFNSRDVGFDRALIGGYGHDDRVCSYPALTAICDGGSDEHTVMVVLADKEEIGSEGNTGMQCGVYSDLIDLISAAFGKPSALVRSHSKCLSADVTAGYDPNFAGVFEKKNSSLVSCGTTICKFTGSGGKGGSSDANAEFVGYVRDILDKNGVNWQTAELGKVDAGGGGTVAKFIAKLNIDTLDIGVPVISMHAPYEVISKGDLYSTYEAFLAFIK